MPTTADYLDWIQQLESRSENLREKIASLKDSQKEYRLRSPERKKVSVQLEEAKEAFKQVKEELRENKIRLKQESAIEIRRDRENGESSSVGRPPKGGVEMARPKRGRPRKDKSIVVEKGKRGRPRKEVVELSVFRKEVEQLRQEMGVMNAKMDRMASLLQQLIKRKK